MFTSFIITYNLKEKEKTKMRKYLLLIITCFLLVPVSFVKATEVADIHIFYSEKDEKYNALKDAINEIKEDSNYTNKIRVVEYDLNDKENLDLFNKLQKFLGYSGYTFGYSIGYTTLFDFPTDKTEYPKTNYKYIDSYPYYKDRIKGSIDYFIEESYDSDLVTEIQKEYFDYLDEEDTENTINENIDDVTDRKGYFKVDKENNFFDNIKINKDNSYPILVICLVLILLNRLRISVKKNH